jgi:hypothetical protein
MSDELERKYEVEIKSTEEKVKLTKELKAILQESGMMDEKRMKQEFVDCPVLKADTQFIQCFVCPNFQSRVMGKVFCKGDPLN